MPFDANLVMHDGTAITANISPTSETRTSGSAVIDLLQGTDAAKGGETAAIGMTAVLIVAADLEGTSDTLQVTIEDCATVDGTYIERASFPLLTKGTGMPGTYTCRFTAFNRYVRAKIVVSDFSGSGYTVVAYILLSQYPFKTL